MTLTTSPERWNMDRGESNQIALRLPSDLEIVEETIERVARHCLSCGLPARSVGFNLRIALAEALSNAIVYGNRLDPSKRVHLRVAIEDHRVEVHVQDEGDGFNPAVVPDPRLPDRLEREDGRGLFLIRQLVDHVAFNDQGNSICMVLEFA